MKKTTFTNFTPLLEASRSAATRGGRLYKNVTLIQSGLGNRRDRNFYPPKALKEAASKGQFEGLRAFADHPDAISEETRPERSIRDIVGVYTNTKFKEGKGGGSVVGDLRVLKSAGWLSDMIDELVDMGQADKVGISINGRGETEPKRIQLAESGEELDANVLQRFLDLRSADVVTEAGAGGGFQQLLESARGSREKQTMKRSEFKRLTEAAAKGDKDAVKKLAKAAEAAVVEEEDGEAEGDKKKTTKEAKAKVGKKVKKAAPADDETQESADADAELDATADELIEEAEGDDVEEADADESGDAAEGDEADDAAGDAAEGDDEAADDEAADDGEGDGEVSESDEGEEDEPADKKKTAKKTREAVPPMKAGNTKNLTGKNKQVTGKAPKNVKGVKASGAGSFVKNASGPSKKGNSFGYGGGKKGGSVSGRTREAELEAQLEQSQRRNSRLAEALKVRQTSDKAKKMLRESKVPDTLRPNLLRRMVGRSEEEMREEIAFTERLLEAAGSSRVDEFDEVEGAGSSIRESFGRGSDSGDGLDDLLEGVPLREAADDDSE